MNENEKLREQMWDLVYGLLSGEEVAALHKQIKSDPAAARLYAEVRLQADLVASAAKVEDASIVLSVPDEARKVQPAAKSRAGAEVFPSPFARPAGKSTRAPSYRLANAITAIAATALVALIGYGFFGDRSGRTVASNNLVVAEFFAPSPMASGLTQAAKVRARNASGEPVSTSFVYTIVDRRGEVVDRGEIQTDERGEAQLSIPGKAVQPGASLEMIPQTQAEPADRKAEAPILQRGSEPAMLAYDAAPRFVVPLPAQPEPITNKFTFNQDVYQPGDKILVSQRAIGAFSGEPVPPPESDLKLVAPDGTAEYAFRPRDSENGKVRLGEIELPADARQGLYDLVESDAQTGKRVAVHPVPVGPQALAAGIALRSRFREEVEAFELRALVGGAGGTEDAKKISESKSGLGKADASKEGREKKLAVSPPAAPGGRGSSPKSPAAPSAPRPDVASADNPPPPAPAKREAPSGGERGQDKRIASDPAGMPSRTGSALQDEKYKKQIQQTWQSGPDAPTKEVELDRVAVAGDGLAVKIPAELESRHLLAIVSKGNTVVAAQEYDGKGLPEDSVSSKVDFAAAQPATPAPSPTTRPEPRLQDEEQPAKRLKVSLPPEADGELTWTLLDRTANPPVVLYRQRVHRESSRKLNVEVDKVADAFVPEQSAFFKIHVTNQKGEEVPGASVGARLVPAHDVGDQSESLSSPQGALSKAVAAALAPAKPGEKGRDTDKKLKEAQNASKSPAKDTVEKSPEAQKRSDRSDKFADAAPSPPAAEPAGARLPLSDLDALQQNFFGAPAEDSLAELPQEKLLASNSDQILAEVSRHEQAQTAAAAAFRQFVARVLLVVATGTLVILGVLAIMHWSAQAKFWAPAMVVVGASFIVGCFWLMNGTYPAAPQAVAVAPESPAPRAMGRQNELPAEEAKEALPLAPKSEPFAERALGQKNESAGHSSQQNLEMRDKLPAAGFAGNMPGGVPAQPGAAGKPPGLAGASAGGSGFGGGGGSPEARGLRGDPATPAKKKSASTEPAFQEPGKDSAPAKNGVKRPAAAEGAPVPAPAESPAPAEKKSADKEETTRATGAFQKGMLKQQYATLDDRRKKELAEKDGDGKAFEDPKPAAASPKGGKEALADKLEKLEGNRQKARSSQLLFAPDLAADAKGEVQLGVQLPKEPGDYWLIIDAYGAGGAGTLEKRLLVRVPPAAGALPAGPAAPAAEAKPTK